MATAVALLSGGLDSGAALALWIAGGHRVLECLYADYGQRAADAERRASRALAARYGLPWSEIALPWLREAALRSGSALVPGGRGLPQRSATAPGDDASARAVWVPARNVVLVAAAAALAEACGADAVLTGFNREEAATFADNSAAFAAAMTAALALGTRSGVRVESPTLPLAKSEIVARVRALGLTRDAFWSCYERGPAPCGVCESCVRSALAWGARTAER